MLPPCWSQREECLASGLAADEAAYEGKFERRAYFRANNREVPLAQQYLQRLDDRGIAASYHPHPSAAPSAAASAAPADAIDPARLLTESVRIDWASLPTSLQPLSFMGAARALRKEDQLQNMIDAVRALLRRMYPTMANAPTAIAAPGSTGAPPVTAATSVVEAITAPSQLPSSSASLSHRPVLVDFCCGSGHVGFPLAFLFPWCDIILLEHNASAIAKAHERLATLQRQTEPPLQNVRIVHSGLQEFGERFDLGLGLHACGWLSDCIQLKCMQHQAAFLLAPCCVGKCKAGEGNLVTFATATTSAAVSASATAAVVAATSSSVPASLLTLRYPRSALYSNVLSAEEYLRLASKADFSDSGWDFTSVATQHFWRYKSTIEWDRLHASLEHGYSSSLVKMSPLSCTPKNDMLLGVSSFRDAVHGSRVAVPA